MNFSRLASAVLIVDAVGFVLKYFALDTFLIFFGFRFHLALVLPFIVVFNKDLLSNLKQSFSNPEYKKLGRLFLFFLAINVLFISVLLLFDKIEVGDPEYFYEFGISSIIDFPVYLIWNAFQLIIFFSFLKSVFLSFQKNYFVLTFTVIFLFIYEFIPLQNFSIDYNAAASFIIMSFIVSLLINSFNNIYFFVFIIFSLLWINILAFGSSSQVLINILFAANYDLWEGFFTVENIFSKFILPVNLFLFLVGLLILKQVEISKIRC